MATITRLGLDGIARRLYARFTGVRSGMRERSSFLPTDCDHLTPQARNISLNLKAAMAQHKKKNGLKITAPIPTLGRFVQRNRGLLR